MNYEKEKIIYQLIKGVVYAHNKKVIHRNINPKYIFLNDEGKLKIRDFGIVLLLENRDAARKASTAAPCNNYMSPEIYQNFGGYS